MKKEQTQAIITKRWNFMSSSGIRHLGQNRLHITGRLVTTVEIYQACWTWRLLSHVRVSYWNTACCLLFFQYGKSWDITKSSKEKISRVYKSTNMTRTIKIRADKKESKRKPQPSGFSKILGKIIFEVLIHTESQLTSERPENLNLLRCTYTKRCNQYKLPINPCQQNILLQWELKRSFVKSFWKFHHDGIENNSFKIPSVLLKKKFFRIFKL